MAVIEISTAITRRSLMHKTKQELASKVLELCDMHSSAEKRIAELERKIARCDACGSEWVDNGINSGCQCCRITQAERERDEAKKRVAELEAALEMHRDDTPCRLDHHGYCQAHGLGDPCEQKVLCDVLGPSAKGGA